jgi:hypothetical protein
MREMKQATANILRCVSLLWLILHFALTALFVMPSNPMTSACQRLLDATIGTYFSQNWQLFSPEPLTQNYALYVHPLTEAKAAGGNAGLPTEGWYDITSPLFARFQQNRFSAYDKLARPQINALLKWLSGGPALASWQHSCEAGDPKACTVYNEQLKVIRLEEGKVLARIASAFCNDLAQTCKGSTRIALRAHEELPIPWSQRYAGPKPTTHDVDIGVYPIDPAVASANIYQARRAE